MKQDSKFDLLRLLACPFFVKVDNFSVASAFEVEYAVVIPAMLVITDQKTLRIGRQSGLSGTGQARCV